MTAGESLFSGDEFRATRRLSGDESRATRHLSSDESHAIRQLGSNESRWIGGCGASRLRRRYPRSPTPRASATSALPAAETAGEGGGATGTIRTYLPLCAVVLPPRATQGR